MEKSFTKAEVLDLKTSPEYNERWLQERIADDPGLLGLDGDVEVKDLERRQPSAGRLDMLLFDAESNIRYEVEIQLGATDPDHIIRTIEYWDIEKSRYPQYEHVAVVVAEDITNRFLNVISLFNRSIPLIAIEIKALKVDEMLTLHATKVLDQMTTLGTEEDDAGQQTDRTYWLGKSSQLTVGMADDFLSLINETLDSSLELKYNKHYIGLSRHGIADNFILFRPRRELLVIEVKLQRTDEVSKLIEDSGVDVLAYNTRWGLYRMRLGPDDLTEQRDLLIRLIQESAGLDHEPAGD